VLHLRFRRRDQKDHLPEGKKKEKQKKQL